MKPYKAIAVLEFRRAHIARQLADWRGDAGDESWHRYRAEQAALTWALTLMEAEYKLRRQKLESGEWVAVDDEHLRAVAEMVQA